MVERRQRQEPVPVERRSEVFLVIRITLEQRQRLASVASLNGLNQSAFVRQAIDSAVLDCSDQPIFGG